MVTSASTSHTQKAQGLLPGVQLLRGCAALLVVIAHANGMMGFPENFGASPLNVPDVGLYGVSVFFTISGFIIAIVSLDADLRPALPVSEYARRRFVRIVPFLWLCVIGYNALSYLGTREVEWASAIRALIVWPVGELKPNVVWSLRHEFLFYALFAVTMLSFRRLVPLLLAWALAPLVIWGALLPFPVATTPWHPYHSELFRMVFLGSDVGANCQLGVGLLVGLAWLKGHRLLDEWLPGGLYLAVLASLAGAALITWLGDQAGFARTLIWTVLSGITLLIGVTARRERSWLRACGMELGNSSFSLYLVHNPAILILFKISQPFIATLPPAVFLVLYVVAAVLAGIVVHRLVEKPLIRALSGRMPFFLKGIRTKRVSL